MGTEIETRFAAFLYRFRWMLAALVLALVVGLTATGIGRVSDFSGRLAELGDTTNGSGNAPPLVFDPRMDLWFGEEDEAVLTYREIEKRFVAEDYIVVSFEATDGEFGVFERDALAAIARLTEGFLEVPGVRHVRSLTSNPWIRYGEIEDGLGSERGLMISDLVAGDPQSLSDDEIVERMIATLGAHRVAERLGEERVRAVVGADADFDDFIGEPLLLGTILDESGTTTAIQVQVLRPRVDEEELASAFEGHAGETSVATTLYSIQAQRASLRGIEHVLRTELGLVVPTEEHAALQAWIGGMPEGPERTALRLELLDPTRNFMANASGELVRKYYEYEPDGEGGFIDRSDPSNTVPAPAGFAPDALSAFVFHVGGIPNFERNFEDVGMSDSKYMGLMFAMITLLLAVVFRNVIGVVAPLAVVFGSVAAMVGMAFAVGDLFNNMTVIAPNMLTAVAIADSVHLVAAWALLRRQYDDKRELIVEVIRRNAMPVFLTSVTTAVGFYSLMVSEMIPVSMFGKITGFGTIGAYLMSMTFVPAALSLVPHRARSAETGRRAVKRWDWESGLTRLVFRRRGTILVATVGLMIVGGIGIGNIRIDSDFRAMFPDDNPVMSDFHWIESRLGGVGDLEVVFDGVQQGSPEFANAEQQRLSALRLQRAIASEVPSEADSLDAEELHELRALEERERRWKETRIAVSGTFLAEVDRFEARLREEMADPESPLSVVTDFVSPLDILRRMHQVQNENRAAFYRVPVEADVPSELRASSLSYDEWTEEWLLIPGQDASTLAAQYYLQYENGARPGENLATQVSLDRTQFRMQGRMVQAPSQLQVGAGRRIEEIAREEFPLLGARLARGPAAEGPELDVSGKMLLFARTTKIFTLGFIKSMSIALVVITILIALIFRSIRIAAVSLIPNMLPIVLPLSFFGLFGIPLDAPAIFVTSVALGVCVDDTIHFFTKFMRARRRGDSLEQSVLYTFQTTGMAITVTSFVLVLGFSTLMFSDFAPNFMMGSLAASMIALAWVADLLVTPAVLSYFFPATQESVVATDTPDPIAVHQTA